MTSSFDEHEFDQARHILENAPKQIERTKVLHDVKKFLVSILTLPDVVSQIVNLYGIAGIGKSFLIYQIFALCVEQRYQCIWIDFDAERPSLFPRNTRKLHDVLYRLRKLPALSFLPHSVTFPKDGERSIETINVRYVEYLPKESSSTPFVLLLDHLDDRPFWKWIQEEIIKPLVDQPASLIICTSRSPLFWHFWELRERCTFEIVEPFSYDETERFLRFFERDILARSAFALTQGYPLKLAQLVRTLEGGMDPPITPQQIADIEQVLASLTPMTRHVLQYTSLLRQFDVSVMQQILDAVTPGWNSDQTPHQILLGEVLPEITARRYFEPYRRQQPLRLLTMLRFALTNRLQTSEPETYEQICVLLERLYYDHFMAKPIDDANALNEWLYISTLRKFNEGEAATWEERASTLLRRGQLAGKRLVIQLYKDHDLMTRLDTLGLFIPLQRLIRTYFAADKSAPPILNESEMARYRRQLIDQLSDQAPLTEIKNFIPGGLPGLLQHIQALGEYFDLVTLHQHINERTSEEVKPGAINQAVVILDSCGLVEYEERRYRLTDLARTLVLDIPPSLNAAPRSSNKGVRSA